jgi:hypothetical protein
MKPAPPVTTIFSFEAKPIVLPFLSFELSHPRLLSVDANGRAGHKVQTIIARHRS